MVAIDGGATRSDVSGFEKVLDRRLEVARIGDRGEGIGVGELDGFENEMAGLHFIRHENRGEVIPLQQGKGLERHDALAIRRHFQNRVTAISAADRLHPLGLDLIEVCGCKIAALFGHRLDDAIADLPGVKGGAALTPDPAPESCQIRLTKKASRRGDIAARQVVSRIGRKLAQHSGPRCPGLGNFKSHREPALGQCGSGFKQILEIHRAELPVQFEIAVESAWHIDRGRTCVRHRVAVVGAHAVKRHERPRTPAAVQPGNFALVVDHDKGVATQPVHHRLGDIDRRRHG